MLTVLNAAFQIPINIDGTCAQITTQAALAQSEWSSSLRSRFHSFDSVSQSSHVGFVKMKSQLKCGSWRKDVWVCMCMCVFLSVCIRSEADLKNGSRPGHRPICTAWGRVLPFGIRKTDSWVIFEMRGSSSVWHLVKCPLASSSVFLAQPCDKGLQYLTGLQGNLLHRVLAGRPPPGQESGCFKFLSFHPLFQPED